MYYMLFTGQRFQTVMVVCNYFASGQAFVKHIFFEDPLLLEF